MKKNVFIYHGVQRFLAVLVFFLPCIVSSAPETTSDDDAATILATARMNPLGQDITLSAQLRKDSTKIPFNIVVRDGVVRYEFAEQTLILQPKEKSAELSLQKNGGKATAVRPAALGEKVQGSDLTCEDIALRFLYWPDAKITGSETVNTRKCRIVEIQARGTSTQYGVARVWIDQATGALMRMEGYNHQGKLIRKFSVVSAQPIEGQWMLKQMRVETIDPATRKTTSRTYLEVLGKK